MGQSASSSAHPVSIEQLSHDLTQSFADKCYTPLELYSFNAVFRSLADSESGLKYWSEATLCRFLELPDALAVGSVVFQVASYLGAFPFPSHAPAILTNEALLRVVTILTERHKKVLKRGKREWQRELYRSLAVYDKAIGASESDKKAPHDGAREAKEEKGKTNGASGQAMGFAVDEALEDEDEDGEDDELVLAAFESMDAIDAFKQGDKANVHHSIIPSDNFLRLTQLLLLIAPLDPQDSISPYAAQLSSDRLESLRATANSILSAFGVEKNHGIPYKTYDAVISTSLPYLFDSMSPLFEHFLFSKDLNLSKRKSSSSTPSNPTLPKTPTPIVVQTPAPDPLLPAEGDILNLDVLSQLSFFLKGSTVFRRLQPLYSGNTHGFSMGQFEKSVFNWRAPSILLVSGTLLPDHPSNPRERTWADSLSPKRHPSSTGPHSRLIFGAYITVPWKQTHKQCIGDSSTLLFQLSPTHSVFKASTISTDYVYFNRQPAAHSGLGFGSPMPNHSLSRRKSVSYGQDSHLPLGPVSLHLDDALEFGVFTHLSTGGGSFLSATTTGGRPAHDWQDRFEVDALEVWGCGGTEEAEAQRQRWKWEEREAEMRRKINIGTGDIDADRELLKLAGIIGGDRSGGSMG